MKHIKLFETEQEYNSYKEGENVIYPYACLTIDNKKVWVQKEEGCKGVYLPCYDASLMTYTQDDSTISGFKVENNKEHISAIFQEIINMYNQENDVDYFTITYNEEELKYHLDIIYNGSSISYDVTNEPLVIDILSKVISPSKFDRGDYAYNNYYWCHPDTDKMAFESIYEADYGCTDVWGCQGCHYEFYLDSLNYYEYCEGGLGGGGE